ncbi:BOI-related E3 ubiquitin-protein ligase 1-like [Zingiber officinale]|uniref:BOI-related E3 ubiquitin-protein ligase 1-like n=1 Tax=Zingiber officinale TaxID=94328 RepID=UPI001C4C16BC|nr:BOI-related E3 ubiquitin-protein ligase 1-like [Zingiber officinale]
MDRQQLQPSSSHQKAAGRVAADGQPPPVMATPDRNIVKGSGSVRRKRSGEKKAATLLPAFGAATTSPAPTFTSTNLGLLRAVLSQSPPPPPGFAGVNVDNPSPVSPAPGPQYLMSNQQKSLFDFAAGSSTAPATSTPPCPRVLEDVSHLTRHYQGEVEGYLRAQDKQLRRTLLDKWQRHTRTLLCAAETSAARRIREKETEAEMATRQCAEAQDRLARTRAELVAWKYKAAAAQSRAALAEQCAVELRSQVDRLMAVAPAEGAGENADDAASSAHHDVAGAALVVPPWVCCVVCRKGMSTVAAVPCYHLCLCTACATAGAAAQVCPNCHGFTTGTIRIHF